MKEECIRVEEFRQLKKEIRGAKDYLIVGIDVAKNKHRAFLGTATGRTVLKWLVVENRKVALNTCWPMYSFTWAGMALAESFLDWSQRRSTISLWRSF